MLCISYSFANSKEFLRKQIASYDGENNCFALRKLATTSCWQYIWWTWPDEINLPFTITVVLWSERLKLCGRDKRHHNLARMWFEFMSAFQWPLRWSLTRKNLDLCSLHGGRNWLISYLYAAYSKGSDTSRFLKNGPTVWMTHSAGRLWPLQDAHRNRCHCSALRCRSEI